MSSSAPVPQTPRARAGAKRDADVHRFVTPLSYRMKRNKENSEDQESESPGMEGTDRENDEVLTCSKSAARMITPLELCRRSDAQRHAGVGAKPKAAKPTPRQSSVPNRGTKVAAKGSEAKEKIPTRISPSPAKPPPSTSAGVPPPLGGRKMRATVVPPPSAPLVPRSAALAPVVDLSTVTSPRGSFTVAVPSFPARVARSSSPSLPCRSGWQSLQVPVATAAVVTDKAPSVLQRSMSQMPHRSFLQSCSVPSLLSPSPEPVPSLAQIVIQQLNTPSRQARSSLACPLTARPSSHQSSATATPAPPTPRPRIADFKPLLNELFDEKEGQFQQQSAQQLQQKIDQLQQLQKILQMQQEGLKQQQKAQSHQPVATTPAAPLSARPSRPSVLVRGSSANLAASPQGPVLSASSPRARSSQASRRRFMV